MVYLTHAGNRQTRCALKTLALVVHLFVDGSNSSTVFLLVHPSSSSSWPAHTERRVGIGMVWLVEVGEGVPVAIGGWVLTMHDIGPFVAKIIKK